uniref:MAX dimerization protein 1 n=1 Tax=Petromyzon marinus TaxID=7757 RepID=S4R7M3_PETMA
MEAVPINIQILIDAAEYLERREREAEHGYAALLPFSKEESSRKKKPLRLSVTLKREERSQHKTSALNMSTHNELEKNRRAHLRKCLERLKEMVPLEAECSRHTTLGLLNKAKNHIKRLEEQDRRAQHQKDQLEREHRYLRRRLEQLQGAPATVERMRTDSLGSALSSERSDSDREEVDVDVESLELSVGGETDSLSVGSVSDGESSGSSILASSASDGGYSSSSLKWPSFC